MRHVRYDGVKLNATNVRRSSSDSGTRTGSKGQTEPSCFISQQQLKMLLDAALWRLREAKRRKLQLLSLEHGDHLQDESTPSEPGG